MKRNHFLIYLFSMIFTFTFSQQNVKLELPLFTKQDVVIKHIGYTLSYNEKHEQANWVAYELTAAETVKRAKRSNNFRTDNAVKTGSATDEDYKGSGYDRGHLAPAADMGWSTASMEESFFYSNMSPQVPGFNRGIWKRLEEQVRQWASENQAVYVVTGPVLENNLPTIGSEKVSVPRYYYKVILDFTKPELKGIGFILPNASSTLPMKSFAVSIDSVERKTGIDFFPALPDEQERVIEKTICVDCWSWKTTSTKTYISKKAVGSEVVQCAATTKAGNRCKRMTSNASGVCTQHE
ncbi:MAG: DNA/RNA non-specific endonuclease [Paludibacter sp.]